MSNYFSSKQVKLLAEAKSSKNYVHLKNENQSLKDIMNLKNLNKMMSIHNYWDQNNFSLVLINATPPPATIPSSTAARVA